MKSKDSVFKAKIRPKYQIGLEEEFEGFCIINPNKGINSLRDKDMKPLPKGMYQFKMGEEVKNESTR